ncbi:hypothetical protein M514_26629 [Trichuris suis]|uniref:Uncharacterized protein n=1 Tax=Trichuris suis TaxID=68888 RepID=A0A085LL64_9BILA|nr:hypothetical protein M513_13415 [Trichuris suis]KFD58085.1 hypothetical protein M513_00848 [Trichuris suis]KFD61196.1 hypothetical protein M514_26629 [Trichuris suis]
MQVLYADAQCPGGKPLVTSPSAESSVEELEEIAFTTGRLGYLNSLFPNTTSFTMELKARTGCPCWIYRSSGKEANSKQLSVAQLLNFFRSSVHWTSLVPLRSLKRCLVTCFPMSDPQGSLEGPKR